MENGYTVKNLDGGWKTYSSVYNQPKKTVESTTEQFIPAIEINATGLTCRGPIMEVHKNMKQLQKGDILQINTTDCNFVKDVSAWSTKNQHTLLKTERDGKHYTTFIKKGN